MAVQKNFVIKNGIEVNTNLIFADTGSNKVGIATTSPLYTLHVNGGIGATTLNVTGVSTFNNIAIDGYISVGNSTGKSGQFLVSTENGASWIDSTVRTVDVQTATLGQSTFNTTYTVGLIDVYINGIKLSPTEFTATDSATVVLEQSCFGGETVEFVSYSTMGIGFAGITGLTILDEGSLVGVSSQVRTLNFTGTPVSVTGTGNSLTVNISSSSSSQWVTAGAGIHTLSNVGIGTTNPKFKLEVGAVGASGTSLYVNGDARITGILSVGQGTIVLNGINDTIGIGTRTFLDSNGNLNNLGIVTAAKFVGDGSGLTNSPGSSQWVTTAAGIHTLSNVGIGTTNPTSKLTVTGDANISGVVTATSYSGSGTLLTGIVTSLVSGSNITLSGSTGQVTISASSGSPSQWVTTGAGIHTLSNVGIGTTNPQTELQVNGVIGFQVYDNSLASGGWNPDLLVGSNILIGDSSTGTNLGPTTTVYGINNIFMGIGAGTSSVDTYGNTFIGVGAGRYTTSGNANNFIGVTAGKNNTTGFSNNFIGLNAGKYNTTGFGNAFFGLDAGYYNTTGNSNTFVGPGAGFYNSIGKYNSFFGNYAGIYNQTGSKNIFFGSYTGFSTASSNKIIIGAGVSWSSTGLFDSPNTTKDTQFAIGVRTDSNASKYWLVGDENFNVGIGTTNPQYKLDVGGNLNFTGNLYQNGSLFSSGSSSEWVTTSAGIHTISNVGIGTTNPTSKLTVTNDSKFGGVIETVSAATTYVSGSSLVLEMDVRQATTYTYTIPTAANIGIVSFKNMPAQTNSPTASTLTLIVTQNSAGTGNTTASTGIGTNITVVGYENGASVAGISTRALTGYGTTITLSTTGSDIEFLSFLVHYTGGTNTTQSSYQIYMAKNSSFRRI